MVYLYGYRLSEWKLRGLGQLGWFPASSTAPGRPRARVVPLPLSVHGTAGPGREGSASTARTAALTLSSLSRAQRLGSSHVLISRLQRASIDVTKLVTCDARLRPSPRGQRLGPSSKACPFPLNGNGGSRSCSCAVRSSNDGESPLRLRGGFRWDPLPHAEAGAGFRNLRPV